MLRDLTGRALNKPLSVSDELSHYGTLLGELFHYLVPTVPTGKPGLQCSPQRVIDGGSGLRFMKRAMVHGLSGLKDRWFAAARSVFATDWPDHLKGCKSYPKIAHGCPLDALSQGQVRNLRGML